MRLVGNGKCRFRHSSAPLCRLQSAVESLAECRCVACKVPLSRLQSAAEGLAVLRWSVCNALRVLYSPPTGVVSPVIPLLQEG